MSRKSIGLCAFSVSTFVLVACLISSANERATDEKAPESTAEETAPDPAIVDVGEMSKVLPKIESALNRIMKRAAGDNTLKGLANDTIHHTPWFDGKGRSKGERIIIGATLDDQIEVATKDGPVKVPGSIGVDVEYLGNGIDDNLMSGLFNGVVTWKSSNPHVFVELSWCTHDSNAADRLLTIVREELEREDIRLVPMQHLDWPIASQAERLSQLLPPPASPSSGASSADSGGTTDAPQTAIGKKEKNYASPQDVVAAYRQAYKQKDWRTCVLCLTPEARGALIREFLFVASMNPDRNRKLVDVFEKHLQFKMFEDESRGIFSRKFEEQMPVEKVPNASADQIDASINAAFEKQIGDVPGFLAECCDQYPILMDLGKIDGIVIENDKASGHYTDTPSLPTRKEALDGQNALPRYFPWHFRQIDGSWLFAEAPYST